MMLTIAFVAMVTLSFSSMTYATDAISAENWMRVSVARSQSDVSIWTRYFRIADEAVPRRNMSLPGIQWVAA